MEVEVKYDSEKSKKPAKTITLPSGITVEMFKGKGRDILQSRKNATIQDGKEKRVDEDKMMLSMMSKLCVFDREKQTPEWIEDLDSDDFLELMSEFADFFNPSTPKT